MVDTGGSATRPLPGDGAVPLGRPVQREAVLAGEALRRPDAGPLVSGKQVPVIQLQLSGTQHVWREGGRTRGQGDGGRGRG